METYRLPYDRLLGIANGHSRDQGRLGPWKISNFVDPSLFMSYHFITSAPMGQARKHRLVLSRRDLKNHRDSMRTAGEPSAEAHPWDLLNFLRRTSNGLHSSQPGTSPSDADCCQIEHHMETPLKFCP
jgi:hypothetical protein